MSFFDSRATGIFVCLSSLHRVKCVYRFGVEVLLSLFKKALTQSTSSKNSQTDSDQEVAAIIKAFLQVRHPLFCVLKSFVFREFLAMQV